MLVLALETATEWAGTAVADDHGVRAAVTVAGRRHGESLAPAVEVVCARAQVSLADLDGLCVDVGPGLFTGLRVGVATAKGLGFALGLPVVEVGSLEVLANSAAAWAEVFVADPPLLVSVVDARRGLVFSARFRAGGSPGAAGASPTSAGVVARQAPVRTDDDRLWEPDELAEDLATVVQAGQPVVVVGDGARRYAGVLAGAGARLAGQMAAPDVGMLAVMGVERAAEGLGRPAIEVTARYLRPADVRINWEQRMTRRPTAGAVASS